jgi:2-polyprenyl-3-methyl-5-hydroxy-6-metoxy-1,4-benzoquinol methylase
VSVFGCELSFEAIKNVGKTAQCLKRRLILFHSDELQGTYKNDKYDVISCSHVLEHVDDDVGLLKHFNRLLKREGILVLNLPVNEVWNDPKHAHKYDRESIVKLMTNNGFKILQYTEADRWSAFILNYELHTRFFTGKFFGKSMRLLGAILPATLLDITEKILPAKYGFQQSIIVSQKLQD